MGSENKNEGRTAADYARQQEDIRATQVYGESSLDTPSASTESDFGRTSEERERGQGVQKGSGAPVV